MGKSLYFGLEDILKALSESVILKLTSVAHYLLFCQYMVQSDFARTPTPPC